MQAPTMIGAHAVAPDTTSLSSYFPLPGLGILPVNAFVIKAAQPVLVDTGLSALREPFLEALSRTIDPEGIRWIWLSHMFDPAAIISGHLPVARGITRAMLNCLDGALAAGKIAGPDHATIERLMANSVAA